MKVALCTIILVVCVLAQDVEEDRQLGKSWFAVCSKFFSSIKLISFEKILSFLVGTTFHAAEFPILNCEGSCDGTSTTTTTTTKKPGTPTPKPTNTTPKNCTLDNDLLILADSSGSVSAMDYDLALDFSARLSRAWKGRKGIRIGFMIFSDYPLMIMGLKDGAVLSADEVVAKIKSAPHIMDTTGTHLALTLALEEFTSNPRGDGKPLKALILTDGGSDSPPLTLSAAQALHGANVEIYSVGIGNSDDSELLAISGNNSSRVFHATDFSQVKELLLPVSEVVCGAE